MTFINSNLKEEFVMNLNEANEFNTFLKPEKPFLIHWEDSEGNGGWSWIETEEVAMNIVNEMKSGGLEIKDLVEVGSMREIKL